MLHRRIQVVHTISKPTIVPKSSTDDGILVLLGFRLRYRRNKNVPQEESIIPPRHPNKMLIAMSKGVPRTRVVFVDVVIPIVGHW